MRILIACDKFKGSLTAMEACVAIRDGLREAGLPGEIAVRPIADGGDGFARAMVEALDGEWRSCESCDALGRPVQARYGLLQSAAGDRAAVIEMAEASGLWRVPVEERNIRRSSTFGTGMMIRDAVESGAQRLLIGIGGSATNDGGVGMAAALGVRFLDEAGNELEASPAGLVEVAAVDESGRIELPPIEVACDVSNPLLGSNGASAVYGPQKGATPEDVAFLDRVLARLATVCGAEGVAEMEGAGAAGGLGFGLVRFAGATLRPGFEMVADALELEGEVARADAIITGEGSLDAQTLQGKGPMGVALLAREQPGKTVIGIGGRVEPVVTRAESFDATFSLESFGLGVDECMVRAAELLRRLAGQVAGLLRQGEGC